MIDSIQILIGEQAHVTLSVSMKKGQQLELPEFKPSEYIPQTQNAVNYRDMTSETAESEKHIPCAIPSAVPCVEAAVNIALLSHMLDYPNFC